MYGTFVSVINNKIFNVGIYLRLSREDDNLQESASISNQKNYLTRYVTENGWNLIETYIDDGWSGTSFERPDFQRMIQDVQAKKVNTIITKDLSRLGRDYIGIGYYLEKFFPENNIRYIAINDGIDTFENNSNNDMTPFRSVINDMYAKDISKKVRSVIDNKRKNGEFIGSFAPYGYKKDSINKHVLIKDEETAPVVKRIYKMFIEGYGYKRIATILNQEKILSPTKYKEANSNYKNVKTKTWQWNHQTIKKILTSPTYAGDLAQRKYCKVNYKSKKQINIPREQWLICEGTHDPIVDIRDYELAQKILDRKCGYNNKAKHEHLLTGLIFCGDCGERMTYTNYRDITYVVCSKYKRFTKEACLSHSIREEELVKLVFEKLKEIAGRYLNTENLGKEEKLIKSKKVKKLESEMRKIELRLSDIKRTIKTVYEDKLKGILTEYDFIEISGEYNTERERLMPKLNSIQKEIELQNLNKNVNNDISGIIDNIVNMERLTKDIVTKLIKKVEIFDDGKKKFVKVNFTFKNPFHE